MDPDIITTLLTKLGEGFVVTLALFFGTLVGSLLLGVFVAFGRMSRFKPLSLFIRFYISVMRGTPLMLQLIAVYFGPFYLIGATPIERFIAALIAFILNYAAYFAEIYRSGIESMPRGQYEASGVLGYSRPQTFLFIILPQVIKRVLPSITNEVITLVKDTSLASVIGVTEMFTNAKALAQAMTSMIPLVGAGVFYYVFNAVVAFIMERIEKMLAYYHE